MPEMNLMKALNEATTSEGGYLVPEIWAAKIYQLIVAKSTAIQLCEQITMTSDTLFFPKVASASTAYWVAEAGTITASQPSFSQLTITPSKVAALTELSTEVIEDSNPSIMEVVTQRLAIDIALKIDYGIYNGTGTATDPFVGFRSNTLVSTVPVCGEITTDKISDAILALQGANIEPTDLVIHPKVMNKLRKLKTTTTSNEPLLNLVMYGSMPLMNGQVGKIWGVNVIMTTQLPVNLTSTATNDTTGTDAVLVCRGKCGIFANRRQLSLNKFYRIATDDWQIQSNLRVAFAVNYEKAVCILKNIQTA